MEIREARLEGRRPRSAMLLPTEEVLELCAPAARLLSNWFSTRRSSS
jgi:hypothetical protein